MVSQKKINVRKSNRKLEQVLRMNGGDEEKSYAKNSLLQKKIFLRAKPILQESVVKLCTEYSSKCITIAEMGCSSGPNTFLPLCEIIETVDQTSHRLNKTPPMLQVFLNDLPGNDFNSIFKSLSSFQRKFVKKRGSSGPCFVSATPGNFYGTLFPPHSLHFVHSNYSLQWFSEVPKSLVNKGQIYVTKNSPPEVHEAYLGQFQKDFTTFLRSRSEEVIPGGKMVLTIFGRERNSFSSDTRNLSIWELFGTTLNDMVSKGMIEESKLDSFNVPFYGASAEEVKAIIRKEGSFKINRMESFQMGWDVSIDDRCKGTMDKYSKGKCVANCLRAILEPIMEIHFGGETIDVIFERFSGVVGDYLETMDAVYTNVISMTKK